MKKTMYLIPLGLLAFSFLIDLLKDSISFFSEAVARITFLVAVVILSYVMILELAQVTIQFYHSIKPKPTEATNHDKNKRQDSRKDTGTDAAQ